ncbi:MAG: hypothetical protein NC432_05510 [Roseburia sp.]|nr:hypothetical protein [Roseburia sp.]
MDPEEIKRAEGGRREAEGKAAGEKSREKRSGKRPERNRGRSGAEGGWREIAGEAEGKAAGKKPQQEGREEEPRTELPGLYRGALPMYMSKKEKIYENLRSRIAFCRS